MALIKVRATYLDGRVLTAIAPPKVLIEAEAKFNGLGAHNKFAVAHYITWASLKRKGLETAEYDDWLDLIERAEDIDADAEDEQASDPTQTALDTTGSSD